MVARGEETMVIKKFQGKTEAEAVEAAKKELGANVVVMNVRNVKRKGLFSFLKPQLIEVTVALEEENERQTVAQTPRKEPVSLINSGFDAVVSDKTQTVEKEAESKQENSAIEEKLDSLHILLEQQLQKPDEEKNEDSGEKEKDSDKEKDSEIGRAHV